MSRLRSPAVVGPLLIAVLLAAPLGAATVVAVSPDAVAEDATAVPSAAVTDGATNETGETTNGTEETANETVEETNETEETANDTVEETNETVEKTTNETEETANDTVEETNETVEKTTNETEETLQETTNATLGDAIGGTTSEPPGGATGESSGAADGERTADGDGTATRTTTAAGATGASSDGDWPGDGGVPVTVGGAAAVVSGAVAAGLFVRGTTLGAQAGAIGWNVATTLRASGLRASAWLRRLVGLAGYSRYDDSDPLAHDGRADIYETVRASPGLYLSQLDGRVDGSLSTLRHHLDVLNRENLIASAKIRGRRRYFPVGTENPALEAALNDEASAAVLDLLARHGPASVSVMAERLDRDPSTVSHHLARLADDELVVRERRGRTVTSRLAPEVASTLDGRRPDPAAGDD